MSGWYDIGVRAVDTRGYLAPLRLATPGRDATGAHFVGTAYVDGRRTLTLEQNLSALTTGTVPMSRLPAGSVIATSSATTRPSSRTDLVCLWTGADPGANKLTGDVWLGA